MRVACCQFDMAWEDKPANYLRVARLVRDARLAPGTLLLLPEMFATGFSMNVAAISDSASHQTQDFLAQTAAAFRIYLLGGVVTIGQEGRGRNECALFSPEGAEVARYCKLHPFTLGGEARHYASGCEVQVFACNEFTLAPFICYDLRFPEIFRRAALRGANLFAVIANWPTPRHDHWATLLKARAIENQAYVVGVNRCGCDPELSYLGQSMIIDPRGHLIAESGDQEGTIAADLDLQALIDYRQEFPALNDMRADHP